MQFRLRQTPALLILIVSFVVYAILVLFFSRPAGMTMTNGDEPHYLIAVHSLVYDHDLDLQNNYENRDYRDFFDGESLDIGAYLYEYNGRIVRHHFSLGMPLLLAPAYAAGGRIGVQIFLALLVAGAMSCLFLVTRNFVSTRVAFAGTLFCALTYPIVIYSHQIFPDTVILALTSLVLALTFSEHRGHLGWQALLVGVAVGLMPHFQNKFGLLSLTLYAFFLWRQRCHWGQVLRWSLPPILFLAAGHLLWSYYTYGEFGRSTIFSPGYHTLVDDRIDDGIMGIWFDQESGLFFFAPMYIVALLGAWLLIYKRTTRVDAIWFLAIYATFHLLSGAYYDWPAGLAPVPRYLMPVTPLLVIFVGVGLDWLIAQRQYLQPLLLALVTVYVTYLILFVHRPFMFGFYTGTNIILRDYFGANDLAALLPSFLRGIDTAYTKLGILGGLFLFVMLALVPVNRWLASTFARARSRVGAS